MGGPISVGSRVASSAAKTHQHFHSISIPRRPEGPQGSLLPVRFRQVNPPHRLRLIPFRSQFLRQFVQPRCHAVLLDVLERLAVHAGRSVVGTALRVGGFQHVAAIHLVVQGVETKVGRTLRFVMQRRAEFLQRIDVGRLVANHSVPSSIRTLILELRPLRSTGITRFQRYYEPLRHRRDRTWPSRAARCGCRRCHRRFPVLSVHSFDTCCSLSTPVDRQGAFVAVFPCHAGLPRPTARSASTLVVSRPHRAFTCVTACIFAESP